MPETRERLSSAIATVVLAVALSAMLGGRNPGAAGLEGGRQAARGTDAGSRRSARGRTTSSPQEIPPRGWYEIAWGVYAEVDKDRILAVAAGVTFFGLLAIFPAIGAFVSLYGLFFDSSSIAGHLGSLAGVLPGGAIDIVGEQVKRVTGHGETALGFASVFALGVSLWSANAGMKAIFDALNVAYGEKERRSFIVLNALSLAFTLAAIAFLMMAIGGVVVVPVVLNFFGLGGLVDWIVWVGRWPALLAATLGALAILYRYGPSREQPKWRWITPGSLFAGIGWLAFSMLFSLYVGSFGSYDATYGSLGAAIGFMTWMWLSATILLVGAELNSEVEQKAVEETTGDRPVRDGTSSGRIDRADK